MAKVAADHPADDEAQAFYALALLATLPRGDACAADCGGRRARSPRRCSRAIPKHPGAAHYILHAYDHGTLAAQGAAGGARLREDRAGGEPRAPHARACVSAAGLLGRGGGDRRGVMGRVDRVGEAPRPVDREPRLSQPGVAAVRVDAAGTVFEDEGSDRFVDQAMKAARLRKASASQALD